MGRRRWKNNEILHNHSKPNCGSNKIGNFFFSFLFFSFLLVSFKQPGNPHLVMEYSVYKNVLHKNSIFNMNPLGILMK